MLAFYLAAPEVENDRRALNTFNGMRRGMKEGRWMSHAPIGFVNKITEDGKKYIAPKEPQASIMKWVFEQVSEGILHVEQIMKMARLRGIRVTKSTMWRSLRNPVYCGRIYLKEYKDEPACDVKGNHEPIISETLFYDVQDYLDGKKSKKKKRTTVFSSNDFILRGYLVCPKCGKVLTASASKGRSKKYFYYHCHYTCGVRFNSPEVNEAFTDYLMRYNAKDGMAQVYYKALKNVYQRDWAKKAEARGKFTERLDDLHEKVKKARFKFMNDEISKSEYMEFKAECEKEINDLETRVIASTSQENQIDDLLQQSVDNLINLRILYLTGNIAKQRKIIGSISPKKLYLTEESSNHSGE